MKEEVLSLIKRYSIVEYLEPKSVIRPLGFSFYLLYSLLNGLHLLVGIFFIVFS